MDFYSDEDLFEEDPDLEDFLEDPLAVPAILPPVDPKLLQNDILYVDMNSGLVLAPNDLIGRDYCVYTDKKSGLDKLQEEVIDWVRNCPWLSFDIETYHRDGAPFKRNEQPYWNSDMIGAWSVSDGERTYVFKVDPADNPEFTNSENLKPLIVEIFKKPLVGHNLKFDLRFIFRYYQVLPPLCLDTFLVARAIHCQRLVMYSLKDVVKRYMGVDISKGLQKSNWGGMLFSPEQVAYSGRDTFIVAKLVPHMVKEVDKKQYAYSRNSDSQYTKVWGVRNRIVHLENALLPEILNMEIKGVSLDKPEVERLFNLLKQTETDLKKAFYASLEGINKPINPNSSQKVKALFSSRMGYEGFYRPDGTWRGLSDIKDTDQDTLKEFVGKNIGSKLLPDGSYGKGPVDTLYDYKTTTGNIKRIEEFHKMLQLDHRMYTSWKQWGAISGRTSCPKPNLQNIKKGEKNGINLRHLFKALPGRKFAVVDYSQIQLVIIAEITQDPVMMATINSDGDLHRITASGVLGKDPALINKEERQSGKAANFGLCILEGTLVHTDKGLLPIEQVTLDHKVLTHRGNWKSVTNLFHRKVQSVFQLTTRTGKEVVCTKEHMWRIQVPSANGKPAVQAWLETEDIQVGQFLVGNTFESIHGTGVFKGSSEYARVLGWILSDGGVRIRDGIKEIIIYQNASANPREFEEMVKLLLPIGFAIIPYSGYIEGAFITTSEESAENILSRVLQVDLIEDSSHRLKNFSPIVDMLNREEKLQLIAGLWDGDGSIHVAGDSKINIHYYSVSFQLITDLKTVCESLGFTVKIYKDASFTNKGLGKHILRISGSKSNVRFLEIVPTAKAKGVDYKPKKLFSAEELLQDKQLLEGSFDVYDITVEDDHSFMANGLVSHNCFGMGATKFQDYALTQYGLYKTLEECQDIKYRFLELYKGVREWHLRVGNSARNGLYYTRSLYGRDAITDNFNAATNYPVQGTEKDIVAFAFIFINERLKREKLDGYLINFVHDEIVADCSEEDADKVLKVIEEEMVRAAYMILKTVKVKAEGHVGYYWDTAK